MARLRPADSGSGRPASHEVAVPAAALLLDDVPGRSEVTDDPEGTALGDAHGCGDVTQPHTRITGDAQQHQSMVGKEAPGRHAGKLSHYVSGTPLLVFKCRHSAASSRPAACARDPLGYAGNALTMRGHGARAAAALNAWRARTALRVSLRCPMSYPVTPFGHLQRLTDNIGLLQHADGVVPLHGHGYSVDDVARGLLVVCREPSPSQELVVLGRRYLYFLAQAQALGGKFRNHLGYDRRWHDLPGTEDGWGISLWALGTAAARGPTPGIREESFTRFSRGARVSSPLAHTMAFAALGAAEVLDPPRPPRRARAALPGQHRHWRAARRTRRGRGQRPGLGCANAAVAEAIIVSGRYLGTTGCFATDCACSSGC